MVNNVATSFLALSNTGVKGRSSRPLPPTQSQQRRYYTVLDFPHVDLTCVLCRTGLLLRSHLPLWMASSDLSSKGMIRPPQTCLAYLMGTQDHPLQLAKPPSLRSAGPARLLLLLRFIVIPRLSVSPLEFLLPPQHTANGPHPNKRLGRDRVGQASLRGS
jgi:hypothetical protein